MSDNKKKGTVIALGYFDSVHCGHQAVIGKAKEIAQKLNAKTVVFTFGGNLKAVLTDGVDKSVYTTEEREEFIKALGVDEIYFAPVDIDFLSMAKLAFLNYLNRLYDIVCYVSGNDYTFGKFGKGTVKDIERYATEKGQKVFTVDTVDYVGGKISTTAIKGLLTKGDIESVNKLLGREYSITGTVFEDRKVGSALGFPTLNLKIEKDKHLLKDGVYKGFSIIDGVKYPAVINYGARPTFNLKEKLVEAHLIGFSGLLYGKKVKLNFEKYLRDIVKFENEEQLKEQLAKDVKSVNGENV
ncbi:MAG: riboflavin biosynthesis protein RibF [Clostridia bacterium]|nr:riboflavin biosynthesis protein RibF [Clostridia bacterium]